MKEGELFKSPQILAGGEILSLFSIIEVKLAFTKNADLLFALQGPKCVRVEPSYAFFPHN